VRAAGARRLPEGIARLSAAYGRLLAVLAGLACVLLFAMMLIICVDVLLRNVGIAGLPRGLAWANEVSEMLLYLITLLVAPWLLRQGQHVRVDIVLRAIPKSWAWYCEWIADLLALACCIGMVRYGATAAWRSYQSGSLSIKTLVTPEWWSLMPLAPVFTLLAIELVFRMARLYESQRGPRDDAVSTA
jgi:TRAP-type C4-dicarboxylate transport system permease small subunit